MRLAGNRSESGLTLLELLLAVTLTTVLTGAIFTALRAGQGSVAQGERKSERYTNARAALDVMSREVQCAVVSSVGSNEYKLIGTNPGSGTEDVMDLVSTAIVGASYLYDLYEVGYQLDTTNDRIQRREDMSVDGTFDSSYEDLAERATGLNIRYYKASTSSWQDTWDSTGADAGLLPGAVEISLTVQDELAKEDPQTFTTVVYMGNQR